MIRESLAVMNELNIVHAITSGPDPAIVKMWHAVDPQRFIPALQVPGASNDQQYLDGIRRLIRDGQIAVLGEIALQYEGIGVSHAAYETFFSIADELDVPIAVHLGPGPHDVFDVRPEYRVADGDPLQLEIVLQRHPGLRIYVMHAGWPFIENMIAIMHTYKNVYIDTAFINTALPEQELHHVLRRFAGAGLGRRIMFGSDPHPGAIALSVRTAYERIETAEFLSDEEKDNIFFNNASRFFRLTTEDGEHAQR
jgi:predicted TIM-barrel fold metal-dependent hydrolase